MWKKFVWRLKVKLGLIIEHEAVAMTVEERAILRQLDKEYEQGLEPFKD